MGVFVTHIITFQSNNLSICMFITVKIFPKLPMFCYAINLYVSNNIDSIPMLLDPIKIEHYLETCLGVGNLWVQR